MKIIVGLGDSTTAGTPGFFSPRERPPEGQGDPQSQYAYWIQKKHPEWKVLNRGVRGQRTDQMLRRFDWDVLSNKPDLVIVLGGANDLHQEKPLEFTKKNLADIYNRAVQNSIKVLACTVLPLNLLNGEAKKKMKLLNEWVSEEAGKRGFAFCDSYALLEDPARPGFLAGTPDDIHPDVPGYRCLGEGLARVIERLPGFSHD